MVNRRRWGVGALLLLAVVALAASWVVLPGNLSFTLKGPFREVLLVVGVSALAMAGLGPWLAAWRADAYTNRIRLLEEGHRRSFQLQEEQHRCSLQDLEEQDRSFLHNLHEEIGNPLTGMPGALDVLAGDTLDGQHRETLATIRKQIERLRELVGALDTLRQVSEAPLKREPVDIESVLHDLHAWAKYHPDAHDREIVLGLGTLPLSPVQGDEALLYVALQNLLDNAIKYTRPGDRIELRAPQDGGTVIIEVTDTGPGIPEAEISRIWDRLYRSPRTKHIAGSGLGLAIARTIIERHGGQIAVRSREGEGSAFTVRLPVSS